MPDELKTLPCPFCGGNALEISADEDPMLFLYCMGCRAMVRGDEASSEEADQDRNGVSLEERNSIREIWNTRVLNTPLKALAAVVGRIKISHSVNCQSLNLLMPCSCGQKEALYALASILETEP